MRTQLLALFGTGLQWWLRDFANHQVLVGSDETKTADLQ